MWGQAKKSIKGKTKHWEKGEKKTVTGGPEKRGDGRSGEVQPSHKNLTKTQNNELNTRQKSMTGGTETSVRKFERKCVVHLNKRERQDREVLPVIGVRGGEMRGAGGGEKSST